MTTVIICNMYPYLTGVDSKVDAVSLRQSDNLSVQVEGAAYSLHALKRPIMKSKIKVPKDLCQSEKVKDYPVCSGKRFKEILQEVKEETKILVIVMDSTDDLFNCVKKLLKKDYVEYRSWQKTSNEKKASDWLKENSKKKYMITDEWAVAGFEFDTVIIVTYPDQQKIGLSSVVQRARAKLMVLRIEFSASKLKLKPCDSRNSSSSDEPDYSVLQSAISYSNTSSLRSSRSFHSLNSIERNHSPYDNQSLLSENSTTLTRGSQLFIGPIEEES